MRQIITSLLLVVSLVSYSQKYDNTWLWGIYPQNQNNSQYPLHGNAEGTFSNDTFISTARFRNMAFSEYNNCISDPQTGELLFYSNGLCIRDSASQIIENGDSIGYPSAWFQSQGGFGQRGSWCMLTLPIPDNDNLFRTIYYRLDSIDSLLHVSMCYLDVARAGSSFRVTAKDVKFSEASPMFGGLAACKHANGRDWWVIFSESDSNCYQKYLLTPDTFTFHSKQYIGRNLNPSDFCKNVFSPDGSKLAKTQLFGASDIFDFDRCSGEISNFIPIDSFHVIDSVSGDILDGFSSVEFSPSNRFVYMNGAYFVIQYDLWAADVNLSKDTVGAIDYFIDTLPMNSGYYAFLLSQTAPDGRIYIAPGLGQRFFSTIENPNGKGDSCNFKLRNVVLPKWSDATITYSPNYRLGRLFGSACDTIYSDIKPLYTETPWLKVFPNPATDIVRLDYNWIEWDKLSACELQISDLEGRLIFKQKLPKYTYRQDMDISQLAQGVYTAHITATMRTGEQKKLATTKLVKQE